MAMAFARERLRRDWVEVSREPSLLVAAEPLPSNIFEWHANLRPSSGVLAGIIFHVRITFPEDYPNSPPFLHFPRREIPSFKHLNLYSFGLCLDILSSFIGRSDERAGWSPAYTVRSLLMQLQSFLFEFDSAKQDHGGTYSCHYSEDRIRRVRQEACSFVCKECGHCWRSPQPPLQAPLSSQVQDQASLTSYGGLQTVHLNIASTERKLRKLISKSEVVTYDKGEHGAEICHAGDVVAHLSAASPHITIRVLTLQPQGGIRFGLAALGCTGLTEGMDTDGCVAWDSAGKLVLGKIVHNRAMPQISVGDELSVSLGQEGGLVFARNGEVVSHDAKQLWPRRPLDAFLYNQTEPSVRGCSGKVKDVRAMLSFRHASIEVVGKTVLRDEVAVQTEQRRQELLRKLAELEAQSEHIQAHLKEANARILKNRSDEGAKKSLWAIGLPSEVLLLAFMGVDSDDVPSLMNVCTSWRECVVSRALLERLQLRCFYTKSSASEDVLGFGVSAEYHDDGNLKALSTELDVLSFTAFSKFGLRRGVWGDTFEYFLPLVLEGSHVQRALPMLEQSIARLASGAQQRLPERQSAVKPFEPWMALAVLPQLMNSFAVSLMNATEGVSRHASEKALLGYCSFHHMLLSLAVRYPCIAQVAQKKVHDFIHQPSTRHKSETPDLGQLLVYCAVTDSACWQDIASAMLKEAGTRSILWLLRDNPRLEARSTSDAVLIRESFQGRLTGLRLMMFQAFFLRNIACPNGEGPETALRRYGRQYGLPTVTQKEALFHAAREILAVGSWPAYYACLGLPTPSSSDQALRLRQAIEDSATFGYHTPSWHAAQQRDRRTQAKQRPQLRQSGPQGQRVGVKKNLQDAFKYLGQDQKKKALGKIVATVGNASQVAKVDVVPRRAPILAKKQLKLKNKFAVFETDTDTE